jgi:4'-phosphopantetheinyl transferase
VIPGRAVLLVVAGVDVWRIDLDAGHLAVDRAAEALSPGERLRARRLRAPLARRRFVMRRLGLRAVLAEYSGADPARLTYRAGPYGKPALEGGPCFSLSHSGGLALCAVSPGREVGVDVERLRAVPEADRIVERVFSPAERRDYHALREAAPGSAFLRMWTRKEALLKALGVGFSDEEAVRRAPDPERWEVHDLAGIDGHLAALAVACEGAPG